MDRLDSYLNQICWSIGGPKALREHVRQSRERNSKRWLIAQGFQPLGENDDPEEAKEIELPSNLFLSATEVELGLLLLKSDCQELPSDKMTVRGRSNTNTTVFRAPHVLVTHGMKVAYSASSRGSCWSRFSPASNKVFAWVRRSATLSKLK